MFRSAKDADTNCKAEFLQNINVILRTNGFVASASAVKYTAAKKKRIT